MAWIKTIPLEEADDKLKELLMKQRELYPLEYAASTAEQTGTEESIISSHTLIPDALYHAFATFGALMSEDLPLARRQHEMIATMVSVTNDCHY
jgi:alkylhydroperoxidase family enzyme